jgi:hypothetical protein
MPGGGSAAAQGLLRDGGAHVVLGQATAASGLADPIAPAAGTLFGPRGVALVAGEGPLYVTDTGHHRLLIWRKTPDRDHAPADLLIGQPDFHSEGRNAKGAIGPATLNVPTGVAADAGVLAVADAWNHRVLIWHGLPTRNSQPADVVLGQADFTQGLANRGRHQPGAETLNWCYGVALADGALYVADTGNRRLLKWNAVPRHNGAAADLVLGQADFTTRDENGGRAADARGMRWPHGIVVSRDCLAVADAGNNRIMVWKGGVPASNGVPCDFVVGQATFSGVDHNQASYFPKSNTVNMPYGLALLDGVLTVADTANSRLLGFPGDGLQMDGCAVSVAGQPTFADKGDNRWSFPRRDSLCWPYGIAAAGRTLAIADSGNNRVLLWEAAS